MANIDFRTVYAGVRPGRLAILLNAKDPHWQHTVRRVIECLSVTWGGQYSVIVPTDGRNIDPLFWEVLEVFDPDYVCRYCRTGLDWKLAAPAQYEEALEREAKQFAGNERPTEDQRQEIDRALSGSQAERFNIEPELERELKARLAPYFFEDAVQHVATFSARTPPAYPLTPVSVVLPNIEHPTRLSLVNASVDAIPPLWIESVTGATFNNHTTTLSEQGIEVDDIEFDESTLNGLFGLIMRTYAH